MRLLLLITDLEIGGTPTVVRELTLRLRSPTTHVEVASLKTVGPVGAQLIASGVAVHAFGATRAWQLPRVIRDLRRLVRDDRFDVVFSFLVHANLAAHLASRALPRVRFVQSIQTTQPRPTWHWRAQRLAARSAERIVVPTESVARVAGARSGIARERIAVIPNAVDVDHCRAAAVPPVMPDGRDVRATPFRVGFVGRLDPVKRIGDLLGAILRSPANVRLDIYGDGVLRRPLEHKVATSRDLAARVTLHGAVADPRVAYANIDALVLPSEAEGFGLVLIEAMAAGVPVIGSDVDGIRDVIRDGETGLLVPPHSPVAIAAAVARLAGDAALRDRLIANARADVERRFAWPAVIAAYRDALGVTTPSPA